MPKYPIQQCCPFRVDFIGRKVHCQYEAFAPSVCQHGAFAPPALSECQYEAFAPSVCQQGALAPRALSECQYEASTPSVCQYGAFAPRAFGNSPGSQSSSWTFHPTTPSTSVSR
jgi:hypothetical protein